MSRRIPVHRLVLAAAALAAAITLAACGKVGALERPGPMFGRTPTADEAAAPPPRDPNRSVETVDPRDRSTDAPPAPDLPTSAPQS